ncbi:ATP synthase F0 subunit 6-like protein [Leptotrombidium deliense]|uniref:F-ATPase protein 6 n=1 Tax=Leptotrombidium deliense TaxID=299467 RepID=A0A443SS32_9ACAR|nr:ATP synthase F0 subunit 6-like protein [Leptotrombidium deliense]
MNENLFASFITPTIIGFPISERTNLIPNTNFINYIYWIHKPARASTPFFYTHYPTIYKFRNSHPPMGWNSFRHKTKASLAHFLPQGTPIPLIPILIVIETISLFIQPMALAVRLTANITAGHLLMHLIGGATLALTTITLIQAYVFTLLVSLYLHDNS